MAFSKAMIIGNLGRDPEMRYTPSGRPVTEFSVAVNQSTKNQQTGEWVEATDWFRVTVWGDRAERTAEQFRKGNRVFVEGRFRPREYSIGARKRSICRGTSTPPAFRSFLRASRATSSMPASIPKAPI